MERTSSLCILIIYNFVKIDVDQFWYRVSLCQSFAQIRYKLLQTTHGANWRAHQHKKNKMNRAGNSDDDVLRIVRLKIALQRAILRVVYLVSDERMFGSNRTFHQTIPDAVSNIFFCGKLLLNWRSVDKKSVQLILPLSNQFSTWILLINRARLPSSSIPAIMIVIYIYSLYDKLHLV